MRTRNYGLIALTLAVVAAAAMAYGVPLQRIAFLGLFLICPLMMFLMMRSMGGMGGSQNDKDADNTNQPRPHDTHRVT